jgi:predicted Zn-dependent protease
MKCRIHPASSFGFALLASTALSCAVNPATGERQLALVSESQEIQMGLESDQQLVTSMGTYDDAGLAVYLDGIGKRMAARSERPNLPWTFRVMDDPVVNAFALPGGYIYITRGIMAYLTSESQLASIVGHEIGHVTARHSVEQLSRAQLAQVGLVAGVLVEPGLADFAGVATGALGLLFLKFGRDDERQSDDLGLRYMTRAGYDPRPMPGVFRLLDRVSQTSGGGRTPEWLSTHPNPANRAERIEQAVVAMNQDFAGRTVGADEYLDRVDGLMFGPNPREGFFRDHLFFHPDLAFQIAFPSGWQTSNQKNAVLATNEQQDAILQVTLASGASAMTAAREFFAQEGISGGPPATARVNGLRAAAADFSAATDQGQLAGRVQFVEHGGAVYQVLAFGGPDAWARTRATLRESMNSFQRLTDRSALNVQPMRLEVVTVDRSMTLADFHRRYPSVVPVERIAFLNQMNTSTRLTPGERVKRVVQ